MGWAADVGAALVSVAVALGVFWRTSRIGLIGWDSLPEIASSRIESLTDFLGTFVEETAAGYYRFKFYRPVLNLSLALDYAVWELDPVGYQLTSAILFGACGFALYRLARGLLGSGGRDLGPWVALAIFFVAPFNLDVVAFVSRRMDLLAGLFICLSLTSQLQRCRDVMPRSAWIPALFTLLAIGSKEIAVIVPPLVFLLGLLYRRPVAGRPHWRRAIVDTLPHVAAIAVCFAARLAAFGELGGHPTTRLTGAIDLLPQMLGHALVAQFGPAAATDALRLAIGIGTLLLALMLWGWLLLRPFPVEASPTRDATAALAMALAWTVAAAGVLGTVGLVQPWYLFVPRMAVALALGASAQLLVGAFHVRSVATRAAAATGLIAIVLLVCVQAAASSLFREPRQLIEATEVADEYLANLRARIDSSPSSSIVGHPVAPSMVRLAEEPDAPATTAITGYTVQAWLDLVYRDRDLVVLPRSPAAPPVFVRQTTTVVELNPRFGRLDPMTHSSSYAVQRPENSDPRSIKESMKRMRKAINRFKAPKPAQR